MKILLGKVARVFRRVGYYLAVVGVGVVGAGVFLFAWALAFAVPVGITFLAVRWLWVHA